MPIILKIIYILLIFIGGFIALILFTDFKYKFREYMENRSKKAADQIIILEKKYQDLEKEIFEKDYVMIAKFMSKQVAKGRTPVIELHFGEENVFYRIVGYKHHVSFVKPDTCSEIYLLNVVNPPVMVCGFTSTVLFNVKQLFPETKVINLLMNSQKQDTDYGRLSEVSNYYSEHGVELDERKI